MIVRPALVGAAAVVLLGPAHVVAHAFLVRSAPPRRAVVAQPPPRVELWFNERLEPAYSRVSVVDAKGQPVDRGDGAVAQDDARRLAASLSSLGAGTYTVRYRVLSVDGHVVGGTFSFTVEGRTP